MNKINIYTSKFNNIIVANLFEYFSILSKKLVLVVLVRFIDSSYSVSEDKGIYRSTSKPTLTSIQKG